MSISHARLSFYLRACILLTIALSMTLSIAEAKSDRKTTGQAVAVLQDCTGIQGTVFEDTNSNGLQNEGEKALGGIQIKIKNPKTKITKNRTTDSNGVYQLRKGRKGARQVRVIIPADYAVTTAKRVKVTLPSCETISFGLRVADPGTTPTTPNAVSGTVYYVDCAAGNDANNGLSTTSAWKSLNRVNTATLSPGQSLLFKRGCAWTGRLWAKWNGTSTAPITIGAYGQGELPMIKDDSARYVNVYIMGSYQIVEYLQTTISQPKLDSNCLNQPANGWWAGFNFGKGSHHNTLRYSKATHMTMGVNLSWDTHHNRVLYNTLTDNNSMRYLTPKSVNPSDDMGAWGVALSGQDQEVAYNYLSNNVAWCTYDWGQARDSGNSIEVYNAERAKIHHNIAVNEVVFSEMGASSSRGTKDNVYAYNRLISTRDNTRFVVTRGYNLSHGPVTGTKLYNNTVYHTGNNSQGVVCMACSSSILTMRNNIIWANSKTLYASAPFAESNNIYWSSSGNPVVQLLNGTISSSSKLANPQFVNAAAGNLKPASSSPGVDTGSMESVNAGYKVDLDGVAVPQSTAVDRGAHELKP